MIAALYVATGLWVFDCKNQDAREDPHSDDPPTAVPPEARDASMAGTVDARDHRWHVEDMEDCQSTSGEAAAAAVDPCEGKEGTPNRKSPEGTSPPDTVGGPQSSAVPSASTDVAGKTKRTCGACGSVLRDGEQHGIDSGGECHGAIFPERPAPPPSTGPAIPEAMRSMSPGERARFTPLTDAQINAALEQGAKERQAAERPSLVRVEPEPTAPPGFRVVGRSGPGVDPIWDLWVRWARNNGGALPGQPRRLANHAFISGAWNRGEYDILEPLPAEPEPPRVLASDEVDAAAAEAGIDLDRLSARVKSSMGLAERVADLEARLAEADKQREAAVLAERERWAAGFHKWAFVDDDLAERWSFKKFLAWGRSGEPVPE